jgi:hypothetical protein
MLHCRMGIDLIVSGVAAIYRALSEEQADRLRRSIHGSLWLVFISCGDSKVTAQSEETSTASETSETTDSDDWPECVPQTVSDSAFSVGPDQTLYYDPAVNWPPGHHRAVCVIDSVTSEIDIRLRECLDDLGQPVALSLDLKLFTDVFFNPPPGIHPGRTVRVSYSTEIWEAYVHRSWYSLRDAETDELLLAAFSDPGPTVVPKVAGESDLENWLSPFEATLGPFGCAPDSGCEDQALQRAFVEFTRDGSSWNVLSGSEAELGDYRLHLGFAGTPEVCDGLFDNNPIEGILIRVI